MDLNSNHLYYFKELATTLNFTKAAKNLKIAQPAMSRAIKNLEIDLKTELFHRNNKSVVLTTAGKLLATKVIPLLKSIEVCIDETQNSSSSIVGKIRIGTLYELGEFKIVPLINQFIKQYPNIEIEVTYGGDKELEQLLRQGKIDSLFSIGQINQENIKTFPILKQNSYLLTSAKSSSQKRAPSPELTFITYRQNDPLLESYLHKFHPHSLLSRIKKKLILNSHQSMVKMLLEIPDTYAVLPELSEAVAHSLKNKSLKIASKNIIETTIFFSYWDQEFVPKRLGIFYNFAKKSLK